MNKIIEDLQNGKITPETILSGITCKKCGCTILDHSVENHFDENFMNEFHTCQDTRQSHEIPNYRQINVYYVSPTNHRGARICIEEKKRHNDAPTERKYFPYNYKIGDVINQGIKILQDNGFNIICRTEDAEKYTILVDNWNDDYIRIKNLTL